MGVMRGVPRGATRSPTDVDGRVGGAIVVVGCGVAGAGAEAARGDTFAARAPALGGPMRPIVTCTYPTPSGASGQTTLTQLPRLRETGSTVPRAAWPMTGVTLLGPL